MFRGPLGFSEAAQSDETALRSAMSDRKSQEYCSVSAESSNQRRELELVRRELTSNNKRRPKAHSIKTTSDLPPRSTSA